MRPISPLWGQPSLMVSASAQKLPKMPIELRSMIYQPVYDEYLGTKEQEDLALLQTLLYFILKTFQIAGESSMLINLKLKKRVFFFSHAPLLGLEVFCGILIQKLDYGMNLRVLPVITYRLYESAHTLEKTTVLGINLRMTYR